MLGSRFPARAHSLLCYCITLLNLATQIIRNWPESISQELGSEQAFLQFFASHMERTPWPSTVEQAESSEDFNKLLFICSAPAPQLTDFSSILPQLLFLSMQAKDAFQWLAMFLIVKLRTDWYVY